MDNMKARNSLDELLDSASLAETKHVRLVSRQSKLKTIIQSKKDEVDSLRKKIISLKEEKCGRLAKLNSLKIEIELKQRDLDRQRDARSNLEIIFVETEKKLKEIEKSNEERKKIQCDNLADTKSRCDINIAMMQDFSSSSA